MKKTYTIDAKDRSLGRVASEAATILMGKNTPEYARNKAPQVQVEIVNAAKMRITTKKKEQKVYTRYSNYPGGLKSETLSEVLEKKGHSEPLTRAIYGMLPANRLRSVMMKNIIITE